MESETQRSRAISPAVLAPHPVKVSAHCNRVPVVDGHRNRWRVSAKPSNGISWRPSRHRSVPQSATCPARPRSHHLMPEKIAQPRRDASANAAWRSSVGGSVPACLRLQIHRARPQHHPWRGRRRRPPRGDAHRRDARLAMIM
jgi:hypothetical protein